MEFITKETGQSVTQVRKQIWLMDEEGLVVRYRAEDLEDRKIPYAHEHDECADLSTVIDLIKPTAIVGTPSLNDSKGLFTKPVLKKLAEYNDKPIVLALSTPFPECTADEAYSFTDGKAIYVGGGYRNCTSMMLPNGKPYKPSVSTSAYVFPGLALGQTYCGATKVRRIRVAGAPSRARCSLTGSPLSFLRVAIFLAIRFIRRCFSRAQRF